MPEVDALVLHPTTIAKLQAYQGHPGHALMVTGPRGSGKRSVSHRIAAELLGIATNQLSDQPYVHLIANDKDQAITIEQVRQLEHFLILKVPGNAQRIIVIEDAQLMTSEAQNALLKTLEEPPEHTIIIMTVANEEAILPTIRSRVVALAVQRPDTAALQRYFQEQGYTDAAIQRSQLMSGGLPGLMAALLDADTTHPLVAAAGIARDIIRSTSFERLTMVDPLAKQKQVCLDVLTLMQQMAHVALSGPKPSKQWQNVLTASYYASEQLLASVQPKLVLTNLMLNL